jgi:ankyrin repeat protein
MKAQVRIAGNRAAIARQRTQGLDRLLARVAQNGSRIRPAYRAAIAALLGAGLTFAATDLRLLDAVKRRDHKQFAELIQAKADVNAAQPDGATALAWAAYLDDRDSVTSLLASGAKVNTADQYGETPLTLACSTGDDVVVSTLLKAGANAKVARWNGETALMIAANSGSVASVKDLIAAGADVAATEPAKGQDALMWASAEGHADVVQALLDAGANAKAESKSGFAPLVFAAEKNSAATVSELIAAGADANYALPDGTKVLSVAAASKSTKVALVLLDRGANPNVADHAGMTPLHTAAETGSLELTNALLAKGANPNALTAKRLGLSKGFGEFRLPPGQMTALMIAAKANHEDIMRALIEHHADAALKAQDGTTLLMFAAGSGHVSVVKYAYRFDQDVKAANATGDTIAHAAVTGTLGPLATQEDICEVIQFLFEKGAPIDMKDARGRTPMDIADILPIDKAVDLMTKLIVQSGAKPVHPSAR